MDDTIEAGKDLLSESVQAFKTGLRGDEYVPGSGRSEGLRIEQHLAKLDELHASGVLTDSEYASARSRITDVSTPAAE